MSISWIAPAVLAGLGLIVLPIIVHLLVRQPVEQFPFPSLRFLKQTQLAALRRRTIQDALLLLCRVAIIALAAVALAGPVLQTQSRMASFANRTSRAIVSIDGADEATTRNLSERAFASAQFGRTTLRDALADAVRWLNAQPASSREVVVTGALRRGAIQPSDLAVVPEDIGIRFEPVSFMAPNDQTMSILARRGGSLVRIDRPVIVGVDTTTIREGKTSPVAMDLITIDAPAKDRELAEAALRAVLDAGVPWTDFTTPVVLRLPEPLSISTATDVVIAALTRHAAPQLKEPLAIVPAQLEAWSRPPRGVSPDAPLSDEGDRRWVWGAVLMAMVVETILRRSASGAAGAPGALEPGEEARVA